MRALHPRPARIANVERQAALENPDILSVGTAVVVFRLLCEKMREGRL